MKDGFAKLAIMLIFGATVFITSCREPQEGESPVLGLNNQGQEVLTSVSDREYNQIVEDSLSAIRKEASRTLVKYPSVDRVVIGISMEAKGGVPLVMEAEAESGVRFHFTRGNK